MSSITDHLRKRKEETEQRLLEPGLSDTEFAELSARLRVLHLIESALEDQQRQCSRCGNPMDEVLFPTFMYKGIAVHNVYGFRCRKCENVDFTPDQLAQLEEARKKVPSILFKRKISYVGRSLIITIPGDLVEHLRLRKGQTVHLIPVDTNRFMVEIVR